VSPAPRSAARALALVALCASAQFGASCALPKYGKPPPDPAGGLFLLERDVFAAIQKKDIAELERLLAVEFVLRQPGQPDQDRRQFLAGIQTLPGTLEVAGEGLDARVVGDTGVVTGIQRSKVKLDDGRVIEDVQMFTDVAVFRESRWQLALAHSVPMK
jgi:ketosteroid isomerase-like protein